MIADIRLRKFDMKTLKAGSVVVLIGKRETGKSFLVKDIFEIYKDMFGLKYKVTKPRVNEKIHEIMASSEEIPRMKYLKKHDVYIIDPVKKFDDVDFKNDEYSSQNVVLSKEELSRYLENKGFYTS